MCRKSPLPLVRGREKYNFIYIDRCELQICSLGFNIHKVYKKFQATIYKMYFLEIV